MVKFCRDLFFIHFEFGFNANRLDLEVRVIIVDRLNLPLYRTSYVTTCLNHSPFIASDICGFGSFLSQSLPKLHVIGDNFKFSNRFRITIEFNEFSFPITSENQYFPQFIYLLQEFFPLVILDS